MWKGKAGEKGDCWWAFRGPVSDAAHILRSPGHGLGAEGRETGRGGWIGNKSATNTRGEGRLDFWFAGAAAAE